MKTTSSTLPTKNVKRKAPHPPNLIVPKSIQPTEKVNGQHMIDGKKTSKKRRAPSPPRDASSSINYNTTSNQGPTESETGQIVTTDKAEHKSAFPVFVAPPPPESTPPPIDECETPVGPIDLGKLLVRNFCIRFIEEFGNR